jgi:hypothetical protein
VLCPTVILRTKRKALSLIWSHGNISGTTGSGKTGRGKVVPGASFTGCRCCNQNLATVVVYLVVILRLVGPALKMPPADWKQLSPYCKEFGDALPSERDQHIESSSRDHDDTIYNIESHSSDHDDTIYNAKCYCGRVKYQVRGDPTSSKLCHCRGCQQLHGAPFEWVSIFHKHNVRFSPKSLSFLYFYSGETDQGWDSSLANQRILPVKVSCAWCRTPIADEGRNMWLAFTTLFGFSVETGIPKTFQHTNHLFYGQRCIETPDDKVKWTGHKNNSDVYKEEEERGL